MADINKTFDKLNIHGWINLNKPYGISSAYAVNQVKKILSVRKAGHAGTLDPLASGVLPIALGEATKTIPYVIENTKSYLFSIKWGEQRNTDDASGKIIKQSNIKTSNEEIKKALTRFIGTVEQTPPDFSAINISGTRAYKLARNDCKILLQPRLVNIYNIELLSFNKEENIANFFVICGKGVYIRSIARDLGNILGCLGYVCYLKRQEVGCFKENQSINLNELKIKKENNNHFEALLPLDYALNNILNICLSDKEVKKIQKGQNIILNNLYKERNYDICYASMGGLPVAICSIVNNVMRPIRVFNI